MGTILIDMEFALVQQVEKSNNSGTVTTKKTLKKMGQCLFNKLRALNIYDDSGERLQPLSELTEARIHTLLKDASKATIECPICHAPVRSDSEDGLLDHIRAYHVPDAELPPPRGNEKVYIFTASNGWARNFLKRHNIHSVRTQASPSAASPSAASASPSAASPSAALPSASPSAAADMEDESNTSDVLSNAAAAAVAASAAFDNTSD